MLLRHRIMQIQQRKVKKENTYPRPFHFNIICLNILIICIAVSLKETAVIEDIVLAT
jgi:hypothetical protein